MLNKHLQQDGPSEFAAAVFEQRDYDAVYHGATAPRSSVQHIYGPADEGSPAGVAPRSRDSAFVSTLPVYLDDATSFTWQLLLLYLSSRDSAFASTFSFVHLA